MTDFEKFKQEKRKAININTKDNLAKSGKVIFGTPENFNKKEEEISNINDNSGKIVTYGTIFSTEIKEIYGNRILYKFDIIDDAKEKAISCKIIIQKNDKNTI